MAVAAQLRIERFDTGLHLLPVHHATGIWIAFFPFLQTGACIEFKPGAFDPQWTWDRFRRGGLTHFAGVPTIFMRMMRYYQAHLAPLPVAERSPYDDSLSQFKLLTCGTSALPKPLDDFWAGLMRDRRICQRYGATETGVVLYMPLASHGNVPSGTAGKTAHGIDIQLTEGNEGEIYAKSWYMFRGYLDDPVATSNAHDARGYFKTGDVARREGDYYFIVGRASIDIIKSGGYKISALDIEREILSLPYINEAMVVGVADDEFGQRVGAAVTLRSDPAAQDFYRTHARTPHELQIEDLRRDLRGQLAGYKLPTLLRVVHGEIPKSGTGKVVKKSLGPTYFPADYETDVKVQVWRSAPGAKL